MNDYLALILGVICAGIGGDLFVRGAVGLAYWARVSPGIIGATVAAFATSSPELSVSISSALAGKPQIALGDALGAARAAQIIEAAGLGTARLASLLEFHLRGRLSRDEFDRVADLLTVDSGDVRPGLIPEPYGVPGGWVVAGLGDRVVLVNKARIVRASF